MYTQNQANIIGPNFLFCLLRFIMKINLRVLQANQKRKIVYRIKEKNCMYKTNNLYKSKMNASFLPFQSDFNANFCCTHSYPTQYKY